MVKNALESITKMGYDNFEVAFIDDSENSEGQKICRDYFSDFYFNKIKFYTVGMSTEQKIKTGGSIFGKYANIAITESDADIVFMLCDDDAITENYLKDLNKFYIDNPNVQWSYCKVKFFNPENQKYYEEIKTEIHYRLSSINHPTGPIDPYCRVDASQVSFRRNTFLDNDVWFAYPLTKNLDANIYSKMYKKIGNCYPNNIIGQHKGVHYDQLGFREQNMYDVKIP